MSGVISNHNIFALPHSAPTAPGLPATAIKDPSEKRLLSLRRVNSWNLTVFLHRPVKSLEYRPTVWLLTSACLLCTGVASYLVQSSAESSASLKSSHPGVQHSPPPPSPCHWPKRSPAKRSARAFCFAQEINLTRLRSLLLHLANPCSSNLQSKKKLEQRTPKAISKTMSLGRNSNLKQGKNWSASWTNWRSSSNWFSASALVAQTAKDAIAVLCRPVTCKRSAKYFLY